MFHFSAPKSAVDNSSELTRSLQLNEEVYYIELHAPYPVKLMFVCRLK